VPVAVCEGRTKVGEKACTVVAKRPGMDEVVGTAEGARTDGLAASIDDEATGASADEATAEDAA
jgi:hypothetical protein